MKKRLLNLLLGAIMLFSCCMPASAAKETRIVYLDHDKYVEQWSVPPHTVMECGEGKVNGCLIGSPSIKTNEDWYLPVPLTKGETYRVEFWIRTETESGATIDLIHSFDNGYFMYEQSIPIGKNWKKVSASHHFDGRDNKGNEVDGSTGQFLLRLKDEKRSLFYLDEFEIYALGNAEHEKTEETPSTYVEPDWDEEPDFKEFSDMKNHWAETSVEVLAANGYLSGVSETEFSPDNSVTRAEFLKMAVSALRVELSDYEGEFSDVEKDAWYAKYIQTAYNMKLLPSGFVAEKQILPDAPIKRQEAAAILGKIGVLKGLEEKADKRSFSDESLINEDLKSDVKNAISFGLIAGFEDGSFRPEGTLTRAQAAMLQYRIIEIDSHLAVYVDGDSGSDKNDGSLEHPFKTVEAARDKVRSLTKNMQNHIFVYIKGTEYYMDEPLVMTEADSGLNGYFVVYTSYGDKQASFTGGRHIKNWTMHDKDKNIYVTMVGSGTQSRQLFIDGVRAVRARSEGPLNGAVADTDLTKYTSYDVHLSTFKKPSDLEFMYRELWTNSRCGVADVVLLEGGQKVDIIMDQPGFRSAANKGSTSVVLPVYYENAYELLDEDGEWYLDTDEGMLYYKPRAFEDMSKVDAVLPVEEQLVQIDGTLDDPFSHVIFRDLSFEYTTWMRPSSEYGHSDAQSNYLRDRAIESKDHVIQTNAFELNNIENITFDRCTFTKLGAPALAMFGGIHNTRIIGNEFYDLSATGIQLGDPTGEYAANPPEEKYAIRNVNISDNYIHHVAIDHNSSVGIAVGFVKDTVIEHNEIYDIPYDGIHSGWGWEKYFYIGSATENYIIQRNYIHQTMKELYDGGSIYTIGGRSKAAEEKPNYIRENYITNLNNCYGCIYTDSGSQDWQIISNVCDLSENPYVYKHGDVPFPNQWLAVGGTLQERTFVDNNYTTTDVMDYFSLTEAEFEALTPRSQAFYKSHKLGENHVYPDANWPAEAQAIADAAGLRGEYLTKYYPAPVQDINYVKSYDVATGDTFKLSITAEGRKNQPATLNGCGVYYRSLNPEIVSVDDSGNVTALKSGEGIIRVSVLVEDILKVFDVTVKVDNNFSHFVTNTEQVVLTQSSEFQLKVEAETALGDMLEVAQVNYQSADTSIAEVDENGLVKAKGLGKTNIILSAEHEGQSVTQEIPVVVMGNDEEVIYDFTKSLSKLDKWSIPTGTYLVQNDDIFEVSTPQDTVGLVGQEFLNETLEFDIQVNVTGSWPSIVFRADDATKEYTKMDCYMLFFEEGGLGLTRFNWLGEGEPGAVDFTTRFPIYGEYQGTFGPGGPNVVCDFHRYQKHNVKISAVNEEEGVRIKVYIDDNLVMNYLDDDEHAIRKQGGVGIYSRKGNIIFSQAAE